MSADEPTLDIAAGQAEQLASDFLNTLQNAGEYPRELAALLADMALSDDPLAAQPASRAFFKSLVERLADSFDPAAAPVCNRLLAQLIQGFRNTGRGSDFGRSLDRFRLQSEDDLVRRAESLRRAHRLDPAGSRARAIKLVIVLSRVTIGADVAVTSVIIERIKHQLPDAEIVLLGGGKAAELFGGDPRMRFQQIDYRRGATAVERLLRWLDALAAVDRLTESAGQGERLIIDPDSRLTQLGLLPVAPSDDYLFFPSREYGADSGRSLAELASAWLDDLFGQERKVLPRISPGRDDLSLASEAARQLRHGRARPIVAINFGDGGNASKRAGDHFERAVVGRLIQQGAIILLDKGFGEEEAARADAVIRHARSEICGAQSVEADERSLKSLLQSGSLSSADLLALRCRVGLLAAMIGQSDLYIGYDSAGQHIAAALGVPCIDVFAGFSSRRMLDRWRPTGRGRSHVIAVDSSGGPAGEEELLAETLLWARRFLRDEDHHT